MKKENLGRFLQKWGVLIAFLLLILVNAVWQGDVFLQPENLRNIVMQNSAVGIVALGMTLVIVIGGIDLSVGSIMALTAGGALLVMERMMSGGQPELAAVSTAVGVCIVGGSALGYLNGILITVGRLAPFIATLVGFVGYRSVIVALAKGGEIRSASREMFTKLGFEGWHMPLIKDGAGRPLLITWSMLTFLALAFITDFLLNRTRYGRYAIAVGANERAARYSAIDSGRVKRIAYALLGMFSGIAALGIAARNNSVSSPQLGQFMELDAIAAVVIGGTSMAGGYGRVWGTVLGVLMLGIITNMLVIAGVSQYWQGAVKGVIILLAVLIQRGGSER